MAAFDPISALLGGALIGLASVLLMMLTGRIDVPIMAVMMVVVTRHSVMGRFRARRHSPFSDGPARA